MGDGSEYSDVSSMKSDFVRSNRFGLKRTISGIDDSNSDNSSEMEVVSEDEEINKIMRRRSYLLVKKVSIET